MSPIPTWQLPELLPRDDPSPTWMVVFLCPMKEEEREEIMQKLIIVDEDWPDRPSCEPRRLLQVPWLIATPAHPSILSSTVKRAEEIESLIFVDEQSLKDDTVILVNFEQTREMWGTLRAPFHKANVLLSAAAEGIVLEGMMPLPDSSEAITKQGTKSYGENPVFILDKMTEEEIQKIKDLFSGTEEGYDCDLDWVDISSKLEVPDIEGLLEYFESEEHEMESPPSYFLAVDHDTLEFANRPEGKARSEAVILASQEAGRFQFSDDVGDGHSEVCMGYGVVSRSVEDAMEAALNLSLANMDFCELASGLEYVYWKGYQPWVDANMDDYEEGEKSFASAWVPGKKGRVDCERYH
ncbi:hypothetical protein N7486_007603 [Penicillium sp. IBT 16267x]|nr:hypothetical protein N7486_007603 [Penicillium sp. IBT 16267x]